MSTTYQTVGEALYAFMNTLVITTVVPEGWGSRFNYPPKEIELYPAFYVAPAEDESTDLDAITDDDTVTYWVTMLDTYVDSSNAESRMRALVDLVRTQLRKERNSATPLNNGGYSLQLRGTWIADIEHGERGYRLIVTVKVAQSLLD